MKRKIWSVIKILLVVLFTSIIVASIYLFVVANAVELDYNKISDKASNLVVFDKDGNEIVSSNYNTKVRFDEIPKNLINAFVCTEDKKFFSHNGVDVERIIKAGVKNLLSFSLTGEGASTITQQLIKNTQLSSEKTINRKVQEIKLALDLENTYSKEEIITAYLNVIYFGNSIYGIKNASMKFFGKNCTELTLSECAILAGVVKNPSRYSPLRNLKASLERRNFILGEMLADGLISERDAVEAKNEEIIIKNEENFGEVYLSAVIDEATDRLGITEKELAYGGYKIYTQYDPALQEKIGNYFIDETNIARTVSGESADSLGMVCNNEKRLISAYYSTYNTDLSEFYRQPGSTIKPFVSYLPLLQDGTISPATPVCDEIKDFGGYKPVNYGGKYLGWISARDAVVKSLNTIAVENMNRYGVTNAISYAKRYGLQFSEKDNNLSTALGGMTNGLTILDVTSAYMTLANGGYYKKASFIEYIVDKNGENIYKFSETPLRMVEKESCVYLMTDMLYDCVKHGTSARLYNDKYKIAGKTGTVQNAFNSSYNNDIWSVSYTSEHTVCVWMGNLSNAESSALPNEYSAGIYPTEAAKKIYSYLYQKQTPADILIPNEIVKMAFLKENYLNEHNIILANEFFTQQEVLFDLFDKSFLEDIDVAVIPEINIDSLKVELVKGFPKISFLSENGIVYTIKKSSLYESEDVVCEFVGDGAPFEFIDKSVIEGTDYEYRIELYAINYLGEKVYIKTTESYILTIPYNFWFL